MMQATAMPRCAPSELSHKSNRSDQKPRSRFLMTSSTHPIYANSMDNTTIRLLRFSQTPDGAFSGKLKRFRLVEAPPFYSASYVWGPQTYTSTITFKSGHSLPILTSLVPFLSMISRSRDFGDKDWWWIDSLCINLQDWTERGVQVGIMGEIYRKAKECIVWLGEEVEGGGGGNCRGAVAFLKRLFELNAALHRDQNLRDRLRDAQFANQWDAVGILLGRKWWARVWTLQEWILPDHARLYCGPENIRRTHFKAAMYSVFLITAGHDGELLPKPAFDVGWNRRRILQWYEDSNEMSLVATIAYLGNHDATDPRDRIYSVLGLIKPSERRLIGTPDYESSTELVYAKLVRSFWQTHKSLDIICFAHIFNRTCTSVAEQRLGTLPSWAPDWRAAIQASPVPLMASQSGCIHIGNFRPLNAKKFGTVYDAYGGRLTKHARIRFAENMKECWADGVVVDVIDGLGGLEGIETRCQSSDCAVEDGRHTMIQCQQGSSRTYQPTTSMDLLDAVATSLVLDRKDKYFRFRAPKHYVSDFLVLCHAYLQDWAMDSRFAIWLNQNKALSISGAQTLGSAITTIINSEDASTFASIPQPTISFPSNETKKSANAAAQQDTFLDRFDDTVRKKSRRLMVTNSGIIGMAPCRARRGDAVVVLFGCSIPLVLRRVGVREAWKVIGEAYVHGFMKGEVGESLVAGQRVIHTFRLV